MASQGRRQNQHSGQDAEIFDQAHLAHYTMNSEDLEREIVGLFLQQLPMTTDLIEEAQTAAEWKLSVHTLKGAAAAVGANQLLGVVMDLENIAYGSDIDQKARLLKALRDAADEFRATVRHIYP